MPDERVCGNVRELATNACVVAVLCCFQARIPTLAEIGQPRWNGLLDGWRLSADNGISRQLIPSLRGGSALLHPPLRAC